MCVCMCERERENIALPYKIVYKRVKGECLISKPDKKMQEKKETNTERE